MKIRRFVAMHLQDFLKPVKPSLGLRQRPKEPGKVWQAGGGGVDWTTVRVGEHGGRRPEMQSDTVGDALKPRR